MNSSGMGVQYGGIMNQYVLSAKPQLPVFTGGQDISKSQHGVSRNDKWQSYVRRIQSSGHSADVRLISVLTQFWFPGPIECASSNVQQQHVDSGEHDCSAVGTNLASQLAESTTCTSFPPATGRRSAGDGLSASSASFTGSPFARCARTSTP